MARKNNVETTISELGKRRDAIEREIGKEAFAKLYDMLVNEACEKNPDYVPIMRSPGRPKPVTITYVDLIKNEKTGLGWLESEHIHEILDEMCYHLGIEKSSDFVKLGIVLADIGLLSWDYKTDTRRSLRTQINILLGDKLKDSTVYQSFAKLGMANDKDEFDEKFFPEEEKNQLRKEVEQWLCSSIEDGLYEEYQSYLNEDYYDSLNEMCS